MTKKDIVAIHGSYFADNFGDTLLVKIMCDWVAEIVGRDNVYLAVAGHKEEQACIGYPVIPKELRTSVTHLIYGGGGYLGERSSALFDNLRWSLRNYMRHLKWLNSYKNTKIALIGVGFGPISNHLMRKSIKQLVMRSELTLFRDQESLMAAKSYGIDNNKLDTCVDIALSLPINEDQRNGIALHIDNFTSNEIYLIFSTLTQYYGPLQKYQVIFDNPHSYNNESINKYKICADRARVDIQIKPYTSYDELLIDVTKFSLIITSKLHVGITTIAQGGRVISIPSHQKTIRLYKQLKIQNFCLKRENLNPEILINALNETNSFCPDRAVIHEGIKKIKSALETFLYKNTKDTL